MELTPDKLKALAEVRKVIYERLERYGFTEDMLKDKALFQLLNLLELMVGHRNYIGMFSHQCIVLEEIFGADAFWDKPKTEPDDRTLESGQDEPKAVVH